MKKLLLVAVFMFGVNSMAVSNHEVSAPNGGAVGKSVEGAAGNKSSDAKVDAQGGETTKSDPQGKGFDG
jgi:hypothetical protein